MIEMLVVLALLALCFTAGGFALSHGVGVLKARGAAQAWQVAGAWAQLGAVWQGAAADLSFDEGRLAVTTDFGTSGADLGSAAPDVQTLANVVRWQQDDGVAVRFLPFSGYPNSAGSLYFRAPGGDYRVIVRLESGLTTRARVEETP